MPAYVKVSGAWKQATAANKCYVKVSGAWKPCKQVYVKVGGAWKQCYSSEQTVSGPGIGKTVTIEGVKVGSEIVITGELETQFYLSLLGGEPKCVGYANYSVTGASLVSSTGNGGISGSYNYWESAGEGDAVYSQSYSYGVKQNSLQLGPVSTNFTITLKATSSKVTIKLTRTNTYITSCTRSIKYTTG